MKKLNVIFVLPVLIATLFSQGCGRGDKDRLALREELRDTIERIVEGCPGEIGVAVITERGDTVTVNDRNVYPMMSVFKVHQALALCHELENRGAGLDTLLTIGRDELDENTWSPMLKEHDGESFTLTSRELLHYALAVSDNNASNLMFNRFVSPARTDSFVATLIPRESFRIVWSEAEMSVDHKRAYDNSTSPLGAAMLINRLFTDSILSHGDQDFIIATLRTSPIGKDRIAAPFINREDVTVGHKTGSGYRNADGRLVAHNDVAYIELPGGVNYTLAVFVKDFDGTEAEASKIIAQISDAVSSLLF